MPIFSPIDVFKERVAYSHSYVQENVLRSYDWRAVAEVPQYRVFGEKT